MGMKRLLISNADDFGLNHASTDAIVECHMAGSVTSTTLMVNAADSVRAADLAASFRTLGVGLHFNLTWGKPISDIGRVSTLVDDNGEFFGRSQFARKLLIGQISPVHVGCELEAQWERLRAMGVQPTHLDSHQHVHAFSAVFGLVAALCNRERIPMRVPWVASVQGVSLGRKIRRSVLATLLSSSTRRWQGRVRWNDGIGSVFDLGVHGEQLSAYHYRAVLEQARGTAFELMVHPVTNAAAMDGYTRIGAVGEAEYQWLRSGELRELACSLGFSMGRYDDL